MRRETISVSKSLTEQFVESSKQKPIIERNIFSICGREIGFSQKTKFMNFIQQSHSTIWDAIFFFFFPLAFIWGGNNKGHNDDSGGVLRASQFW